MTQIIEPNEKSDLKQDVVRHWLSQMRTGILSGFDVSQGGSGFKVTIQSGKAWVNHSYVHDDLTRVDLDLITTTPPAGGNEHWIIYGTYVPAAVFPAPSMTISATKTTPPTVPTLPANSFKIADVFVPSGATGIGDCRIVNAPKLPDRGANDGDVVIERLLSSNMNVLFGGGGAFTYNGTDTLTWTEDIELVATTITNKEKFQSVPLAAMRIAAGSLGPSPVVGQNSILFAVFDRLTPQDPSSPTPGTLRVLNLDAPDAAEASAFYDPVREKIVFVGAIIGGELRMRSGFGSSLPAPDANGNKFLRNDPGGAHYWSLITEDMIANIMSISSFSVSPSAVEVGVTQNTPSFTASYANDGGDGPENAALTDSEGTPSKDVSGTPTAFNSDGIFQKLDTNESVTFTLTADDGDTPDTATTTLRWRRYFYFGKDTDAALAASEANIKALDDAAPGGKALTAGKAHTFTMSGLSNEYVYFAYPTSHGALSTLRDNTAGFNIDFDLIGTAAAVTTENGAGNTTDYYLYKSRFPQTGDINFTTG